MRTARPYPEAPSNPSAAGVWGRRCAGLAGHGCDGCTRSRPMGHAHCLPRPVLCRGSVGHSLCNLLQHSNRSVGDFSLVFLGEFFLCLIFAKGHQRQVPRLVDRVVVDMEAVLLQDVHVLLRQSFARLHFVPNAAEVATEVGHGVWSQFLCSSLYELSALWLSVNDDWVTH